MYNILIIFFNVDVAANDDGEENIQSMQSSLDIKRKRSAIAKTKNTTNQKKNDNYKYFLKIQYKRKIILYKSVFLIYYKNIFYLYHFHNNGHL